MGWRTLVDGLLILGLQLPQVLQGTQFSLEEVAVMVVVVLLKLLEGPLDAFQVGLVGPPGGLLQVDQVLEVFTFHLYQKIFK